MIVPLLFLALFAEDFIGLFMRFFAVGSVYFRCFFYQVKNIDERLFQISITRKKHNL